MNTFRYFILNCNFNVNYARSAHFIALFAKEMGYPPPSMSPAAFERLENYSFPGNIRELKNIIESALIKSGGRDIQSVHLVFLGNGDAWEPTAAGSGSGEAVSEFPRSPDEEERIMVYVGENQRISNAECRQLLAVDKNRAAYLLDKMVRAGLLKREGLSRSTHYCRP